MSVIIIILGLMVFRPLADPSDTLSHQQQPETADYKPAYRVYTSEGNPIGWQRLVEQSASHEIVFFGELHNNAISHWLQLELVKALAADSTTVGATARSCSPAR
jgi:uncharacterized iron-regulated protein